jgi:hypothetical protein
MDLKAIKKGYKIIIFFSVIAFLLFAVMLFIWGGDNRTGTPERQEIKNDHFTATPAVPEPIVNRTDAIRTVPEPIVNRTTHGFIRWDETWRGEMHIIGDIIVEEGHTLTIEPGTKVLIAAKQDKANLCTYPADMRQGIRGEKEVPPGGDLEGIHPGEPFRDEANHISIHIYGTLHAVGTPDQMITITSDSPTPDIWDWNFFTFEHGILSYCIMENYRILNPGDGTIISHNILKHVGECAICMPPRNESVLVEYNILSYAGHELIDIEGGTHIIRNNYLGPNPGQCGHVGIAMVNGSPEIVNNTINGCHNGIRIFGGTPHMVNNTIKNCDTDIVDVALLQKMSKPIPC